MTPKLWAPLNPARRDASFGTLGHTVPEILSEGKIPEQEQEEQQQEEQQQEYIMFLRDRLKNIRNDILRHS